MQQDKCYVCGAANPTHSGLCTDCIAKRQQRHLNEALNRQTGIRISSWILLPILGLVGIIGYQQLHQPEAAKPAQEAPPPPQPVLVGDQNTPHDPLDELEEVRIPPQPPAMLLDEVLQTPATKPVKPGDKPADSATLLAARQTEVASLKRELQTAATAQTALESAVTKLDASATQARKNLDALIGIERTLRQQYASLLAQVWPGSRRSGLTHDEFYAQKRRNMETIDKEIVQAVDAQRTTQTQIDSLQTDLRTKRSELTTAKRKLSQLQVKLRAKESELLADK